MRKMNKKPLKGIAVSLASFMLLTGSALQVSAEETASSNPILDASNGSIAIYELDMNDQTPMDTLKQEVITKYVDSDPTLSLDDIDMEKSIVVTNAFDRTKAGLQSVNVSLNIAKKDENVTQQNTVGYDFTEKAAIKLVEPEGPQIILKSTEVTIDLGSTFNYSDNLGIVQKSDGKFPAMKETDNVDVNTEGTYTCDVTAIDAKGEKTEVTFTVNVKKPAEVIRAEEEAAAAAEAAAAEEAARQEQLAQEQAAALAASYANLGAGLAANADASSIVSYALSFVGVPYVWGGTTPAGFDCSGFTQFVYAQFGISMAHSSYAQENMGTLVSIDNAQPGDLVTWNGHAAIYIGGGNVVNAMSYGTGVAVCSIYAIGNGNMQIHRL